MGCDGWIGLDFVGWTFFWGFLDLGFHLEEMDSIEML